MKIYNWEEVIVKLKENNKLAFEDVNCRLVLKYENGCIKFYDVNDENICLHALVLDRQFKLKEEPVSFMEAVNAYSDGKTVYCEVDAKIYTYSNFSGNIYREMLCQGGGGISPQEILKGKWYIEE